MSTWCLMCADEVSEGLLVQPCEVGRHSRAYVVPAEVVERAPSIMSARAYAHEEWAYHLRFVWVDRHIPGGGVRGYWRRTLCGPALTEPDLVWTSRRRRQAPMSAWEVLLYSVLVHMALWWVVEKFLSV